MNFETAVLGACLVDPSAYWRIADLTKPEHFTLGAHVEVWRAIVEMAAKGDTFDAVTVMERCGRIALDLANSSYSTANVRAYAERLADAYLARAVGTAGKRIGALDGNGAERLAEAQRIVREISAGSAGVKHARDVVRAIQDRMQAQHDKLEAPAGLSTGSRNLDRKLSGGLKPGQFVIIAGRPSMGKTLLALQIAKCVALAGHGVHVVTLEMSAEEVMERAIACESHVSISKVMDAAQMDAEEQGRATIAAGLLYRAPLTLDDETNGLDALCARIRQEAMSRGLALAVIDYLSYIEPPKAERHDLAMQVITRTLKRLARELRIPIILLAQLNRKVEERKDRRPMLSDLRDAGAIEQDADVVILLYRADYYEPQHHTAGFAEAIVAKQRNGSTGSVPFRHRLDLMRFDEADALPAPRPAANASNGRGFDDEPQDALFGGGQRDAA